MNQRKSSAYLGSMVLMLGMPLAAQGQEMIVNGTFDSGLGGWAVTEFSTGTIEWSATQGQPPGAVRLVGEDQGAFPADCFHFSLGDLTVSTDAFMETNGEFVDCSLNFMMFTTADDCTGLWSGFPAIDGESIAPSVESPNQWEHLEINLELFDEAQIEASGVRSFRPLLGKLGDFNDDDVCVFDNVSFQIVPLTPIPAMNSVGLVAFAALLVTASAIILRRVSP